MGYDTSELGTDIDSSWSLDSTGDLVLVSDEDNLVQAICNRLSAWSEGFKIFYEDYGGALDAYFGLKKTDSNLDFIKLEVETILKQEPRLNNYIVECNYDDNAKVHVDISIQFDDDDVYDLNLILNDDGNVEVDENA